MVLRKKYFKPYREEIIFAVGEKKILNTRDSNKIFKEEKKSFKFDAFEVL